MQQLLAIRLPVLALCLALGACGFQLRGSQLGALQDSRVHVKSSGANVLAAEIKNQLRLAEVALSPEAGQADYVIEVARESFKRSVLSVSTETGKVEEYEITYQALLSINGPGGRPLVQNEPVTGRRDYTFDESAVLGKFDEERRLQEDLTKSVADTVLRRVRAVTR